MCSLPSTIYYRCMWSALYFLGIREMRTQNALLLQILPLCTNIQMQAFTLLSFIFPLFFWSLRFAFHSCMPLQIVSSDIMRLSMSRSSILLPPRKNFIYPEHIWLVIRQSSREGKPVMPIVTMSDTSKIWYTYITYIILSVGLGFMISIERTETCLIGAVVTFVTDAH